MAHVQKSRPPIKSFLDLPAELIAYISAHLDPVSAINFAATCQRISPVILGQFKQKKSCVDPYTLRRATFLRQTDWGTSPLTEDLRLSPDPSHDHQIRFDPIHRLAFVKTSLSSGTLARISIYSIDTGRQLWKSKDLPSNLRLGFPAVFEYSNEWLFFAQGNVRCWQLKRFLKAKDPSRVRLMEAKCKPFHTWLQLWKFNYPEFLLLRTNSESTASGETRCYLAVREITVGERRPSTDHEPTVNVVEQEVRYELPKARPHERFFPQSISMDFDDDFLWVIERYTSICEAFGRCQLLAYCRRTKTLLWQLSSDDHVITSAVSYRLQPRENHLGRCFVLRGQRSQSVRKECCRFEQVHKEPRTGALCLLIGDDCLIIPDIKCFHPDEPSSWPSVLLEELSVQRRRASGVAYMCESSFSMAGDGRVGFLSYLPTGVVIVDVHALLATRISSTSAMDTINCVTDYPCYLQSRRILPAYSTLLCTPDKIFWSGFFIQVWQESRSARSRRRQARRFDRFPGLEDEQRVGEAQGSGHVAKRQKVCARHKPTFAGRVTQAIFFIDLERIRRGLLTLTSLDRANDEREVAVRECKEQHRLRTQRVNDAPAFDEGDGDIDFCIAAGHFRQGV